MGKAKTGAKASMAGQGSLGAFFGQKPKPVAPAETNTESPTADRPSPPVESSNGTADRPAPELTSSTASPEEVKPDASASPVTSSQPVAAASGAGLSEEQRKRIEENRRKALERQQLKRAHAQMAKPEEEEPADKKVKEDVPVQETQKEASAANPQEVQKEAAAVPVQEAQKEAAAAEKPPEEMPNGKAKAAAKAKAKAAAFFGGARQQAPAEQGGESAATGKQKRSRSAPKAKAASAKPASGEPEGAGARDVNSPPKAANRTSCPDKETPEKDPLPPELGRASPVGAGIASPVAAIPARRQGISVEPCASKFQTFGTVPWMQYHNYSSARLGQLRASVQARALSLWSREVPSQNFLQRIIDFKEVMGEVVIVGMLHKTMSARPNVIEIYSKSKVVGSLPEDLEGSNPNFSSDGDTLWLEDNSSRVNLIHSGEEIAKLATGLVAGVRGCATNDGKFRVVSICFASIPVPPPLPSPGSRTKNTKRGKTASPFLALVSGFKFGAAGVDVDARSKALEFLLGSCEQAHGKQLSSNIQHVVVCGGIYDGDEGIKTSTAGIAEADAFFAKLAAEVPVDVMPGHRDPTNLSMPQMPLHPHLFRAAKKCCHFKTVSNPYECTLGGLRVLGHGGQPVDDLLRCTSLQTPLEALKTTFGASLLAPTAPDTLATQPFDKVDPFVIETAPHVLFSGGHDRAEHEWIESTDGSTGTLCVCVPALHRAPSIVLVNLHDPREVHIQEFAGKHGVAVDKEAAEAGA